MDRISRLKFSFGLHAKWHNKLKFPKLCLCSPVCFINCNKDGNFYKQYEWMKMILPIKFKLWLVAILYTHELNLFGDLRLTWLTFGLILAFSEDVPARLAGPSVPVSYIQQFGVKMGNWQSSALTVKHALCTHVYWIGNFPHSNVSLSRLIVKYTRRVQYLLLHTRST